MFSSISHIKELAAFAVALVTLSVVSKASPRILTQRDRALLSRFNALFLSICNMALAYISASQLIAAHNNSENSKKTQYAIYIFLLTKLYESASLILATASQSGKLASLALAALCAKLWLDTAFLTPGCTIVFLIAFANTFVYHHMYQQFSARRARWTGLIAQHIQSLTACAVLAYTGFLAYTSARETAALGSPALAATLLLNITLISRTILARTKRIA